MTPTLIKGLLALVPTYMLLVASAIMCSKEKRVWSQAGRYSRYAIEGSLNLLNLRVAFLQSRDGDVPLPLVLPSVVARQSASGALQHRPRAPRCTRGQAHHVSSLGTFGFSRTDGQNSRLRPALGIFRCVSDTLHALCLSHAHIATPKRIVQSLPFRAAFQHFSGEVQTLQAGVLDNQ